MGFTGGSEFFRLAEYSYYGCENTANKNCRISLHWPHYKVILAFSTNTVYKNFEELLIKKKGPLRQHLEEIM